MVNKSSSSLIEEGVKTHREGENRAPEVASMDLIKPYSKPINLIRNLNRLPWMLSHYRHILKKRMLQIKIYRRVWPILHNSRQQLGHQPTFSSQNALLIVTWLLMCKIIKIKIIEATRWKFQEIQSTLTYPKMKKPLLNLNILAQQPWMAIEVLADADVIVLVRYRRKVLLKKMTSKNRKIIQRAP